jgi:formate dehydrogenase maturation protein FdhE
LSLKRKVETLEAEQREQRREQRGGQRCEVCASWPPTRVISDEPLETSAGEKLIKSEIPKSCPACGYEPVTVKIRLIDDWRGGRAEHTHS